MGIFSWFNKLFEVKPTDAQSPTSRRPIAGGTTRVAQQQAVNYDLDDDDEDGLDGLNDFEDEVDQEEHKASWQAHAAENRQKAVLAARAFLQQSPIILDTETTGLANTDEIVEIACIDAEGNVLLNSLVKPTVSIAEEARAIHGIGMSDIADAPNMDQLAPQLLDVVNDRLVLAYNFAFDSRFIRQSLRAAGLKWTNDWKDVRGSTEEHCIMYWYGRYWAGTSRRRISLSNALKQSGIETDPQSHRALDDTRLALLVLKHIAAQTP